MGPTIYLISGTHHLCERREYVFNVLSKYFIITQKEDLNANAFLEMKRLKFIKIHNVLLSRGLNYLSIELQMMEWHDYPLKSLPRSFKPNNLVELIMPHSHIEQLPKGFSVRFSYKVFYLFIFWSSHMSD